MAADFKCDILYLIHVKICASTIQYKLRTDNPKLKVENIRRSWKPEQLLETQFAVGEPQVQVEKNQAGGRKSPSWGNKSMTFLEKP